MTWVIDKLQRSRQHNKSLILARVYIRVLLNMACRYLFLWNIHPHALSIVHSGALILKYNPASLQSSISLLSELSALHSFIWTYEYIRTYYIRGLESEASNELLMGRCIFARPIWNCLKVWLSSIRVDLDRNQALCAYIPCRHAQAIIPMWDLL